jgi:hypothetical protein
MIIKWKGKEVHYGNIMGIDIDESFEVDILHREKLVNVCG